MFEYLQDQPREKHDEWFYRTIIFAVATIVVMTVFALNYSNMIFVSSVFSRGKTVTGEVSIFIKEQGKVNLGAVKVCVIQERKIIEWLSAKEAAAQPEREKAGLKLKYARYAGRMADYEYSSAQSAEQRSNAQTEQSGAATKIGRAETDYRYWFSPAYYFNGLKDCDARTTTDSAGNFSLLLSENKYALAVSADRDVTNLKDDYYWMIWVTPEIGGNKVVLNENNLMTANPPEKVFEIRNP